MAILYLTHVLFSPQDMINVMKRYVWQTRYGPFLCEDRIRAMRVILGSIKIKKRKTQRWGIWELYHFKFFIKDEGFQWNLGGGRSQS